MAARSARHFRGALQALVIHQECCADREETSRRSTLYLRGISGSEHSYVPRSARVECAPHIFRTNVSQRVLMCAQDSRSLARRTPFTVTIPAAAESISIVAVAFAGIVKL